MGIGTSLGAFYDDEFHYQQSQHDPKRFDTNDENVVTPNQQGTNKELSDSELNPSTGMGLEIKDAMPFPDNKNPDSSFNSRFGTLPPSGILNDLKPSTNPGGPAMVRKIDYKTASPLVNITDEDINTAMNVGMAAGPGTMAGVMSATKNGASYAKAMEMELSHTPEEIRQATGWMRSKSDGRMKYEISDEGMKLVDKDWKFGDKGKVSDFIDHPELFKAYPELKDINFEVAPKDYKYIASYNDVSKTLMVNPAAVKAGDEGLLDVVSHELQHAVQSKEGFSTGSNPDHALKTALTAIRDRIMDGGPKEELMALAHEIAKHVDRFSKYMYSRAPGEVEANLTMARRKLTDEQRKKFSPQETLDILEGSENSIAGGTYHQEFNYPEYDHAAHSWWRSNK